MLHNSAKSTPLDWLKPLLVFFGALAALGVFTILGGIPSDERVGVFWVATSVMIALLLAFGVITWHLLFRPLPAGQVVPQGQTLKARTRMLLGLLLAICSFSLIVSTFWDELWHRTYGIPLGEDLIWRPHLMMYFTFGSVTILGFAGLYSLMRNGKGTFQQRFQANPVMGLAILTAAFLLYVIPADPIWHAIYGDDITAWSVPHLLLVMCFITIMWLAMAFHMTTLPARVWGSLRRLSFNDAVPILMAACGQMICLQFFTTEYDQAIEDIHEVVRARPDWMLPLFIAVIGTFTGIAINHTLRIYGAATLSGLVALGFRMALIAIFNTELLWTNAWITILPVLVAIDLWYGFAVSTGRAETRPMLLSPGGGFAAGLGVILVSMPLIMPQVYPYLVFRELVIAVPAILAATVAMGAASGRIADYMATANKGVEAELGQAWVPLVSFGTLAVVIGLVVVFITTASPPV